VDVTDVTKRTLKMVKMGWDAAQWWSICLAYKTLTSISSTEKKLKWQVFFTTINKIKLLE
jgi:hypothetical protein